MLFRSPLEFETIGGREPSPHTDGSGVLNCPSVRIPQQLILLQTLDSEPDIAEEVPLLEARLDVFELPLLPIEPRPASEERLKYLRIPFLFFLSTVLLFRWQFK